MQTLLEVLEKTTAYFAEKGIDNARLNAERLFAHALGCKRLDLYLQYERPLSEPILEQLRPLVARRARREPLQYVLGSVEFFGLEIRCDARALIPRPETEQLAALLTELYKETAPQSILDLGTGSGTLALALAKAFPQAKVTAIDTSEEALQLARENSLFNELTLRVEFLQGSWTTPLDKAARFGLIVSNPPYLSEAEWKSAEPEVRDFEPENALIAAKDGSADLHHILESAYPFLQDAGLLALETGIEHHAQLELAARQHGYTRMESRNDLQGLPRFFLAWK